MIALIAKKCQCEFRIGDSATGGRSGRSEGWLSDTTLLRFDGSCDICIGDPSAAPQPGSVPVRGSRAALRSGAAAGGQGRDHQRGIGTDPLSGTASSGGGGDGRCGCSQSPASHVTVCATGDKGGHPGARARCGAGRERRLSAGRRPVRWSVGVQAPGGDAARRPHRHQGRGRNGRGFPGADGLRGLHDALSGWNPGRLMEASHQAPRGMRWMTGPAASRPGSATGARRPRVSCVQSETHENPCVVFRERINASHRFRFHAIRPTSARRS